MPEYHCPTCKKVTTVSARAEASYRPFCSERCKMIDLGKWFDEEYRVETPISPLPTENHPTEPPQP